MEGNKLVTRERLALIKNHSQFLKLRQMLFPLGPEKLFELLLPISLQYELDGASSVAAMLLIEYDPKALCSCNELLLQVANSNWYLSDKFVPFYLVTQFGKYNVLTEIEKVLSSNSLAADQRARVEGIKYWAEMPAASLSADYAYFEWQEAIEGNNA